MELNARIFIAGHRGLVGSAIHRGLKTMGCQNILARPRQELDLTDREATAKFFREEKPEYVFLAAAKVGGIYANNTYPADFIRENLEIQNNVIHQAYEVGVKRLIFLGSSCIYPRECPQPIRESYLLTGPLEPTNRPYALAKIAGIEMCWSYNRQYGTKFLSVMPTNTYGPGDNYDPQNSHVLPALIRKMHEAKVSGAAEVSIWGSGNPRREFLYSEDLADACIYIMRLPSGTYDSLLSGDGASAPLINVGSGTDSTIRELAQTVAEVVGFQGTLRFDPSKPDGTPRKLLDVTLQSRLGWSPRVSLRDGIRLAYLDFRNREGTK